MRLDGVLDVGVAYRQVARLDDVVVSKESFDIGVDTESSCSAFTGFNSFRKPIFHPFSRSQAA